MVKQIVHHGSDLITRQVTDHTDIRTYKQQKINPPFHLEEIQNVYRDAEHGGFFQLDQSFHDGSVFTVISSVAADLSFSSKSFQLFEVSPFSSIFSCTASCL